MAENVPATLDDVERAIANYPRQAGQAKIVFAAITEALALPDTELPTREAGERQKHSAATSRRMEALRAWRGDQANRSKLDPSIVMPQRLIDRLAAAAPKTLAELATVEGVRQWRVGEWGPALLAACA